MKKEIAKQEWVHDTNGTPTTTSLKVAEVFDKEHKRVLEDIRSLQCSDEFIKSNYYTTQREIDLGSGRKKLIDYYEITKNGMVMLAMGYTTGRAMEFKEAYIAAFDKMAEALAGNARPAIGDKTMEAATQLLMHQVGAPMEKDGVQYWPFTGVMDATGFRHHPGRLYRMANRPAQGELFPATRKAFVREYGRLWASADVYVALYNRRAAWTEWRYQLTITN